MPAKSDFVSLLRTMSALPRIGGRQPWRPARAVSRTLRWSCSVNVALGWGGVALAGASTAFAIKMVSTQHDPLIRDMQYLAIFAQPNSAALRRSRQPPAPALADARPSPEIDYTSTASIERSARSASTGSVKEGKLDYEVLGATEQMAWLRIGVDIVEARKGQIVPGIGKIRAIEQRAGTWRLIVDTGPSPLGESQTQALRHSGSTRSFEKQLIFGDDKR